MSLSRRAVGHWETMTSPLNDEEPVSPLGSGRLLRPWGQQFRSTPLAAWERSAPGVAVTQ